MMKKISIRLRDLLLGLIVILAIGGFLVAIAELPAYGLAENPVHNEVAERYIKQALPETGVLNMVTAIVLDYRAYDTMFETIVLFTATIAVVITLKAARKSGDEK